MVADFCPTKINITRFPDGFRLNYNLNTILAGFYCIRFHGHIVKDGTGLLLSDVTRTYM